MYFKTKLKQAMSDLPYLLFVWFVCQHIPITKSLVMRYLSSILKILTNTSINNYVTDLLAFRLYCINVVLTVCVPFPYGVWGRMWDSIVSVPDHCFTIYFR